MTPRFSIIITSLNQYRYLERALCSVLDQPADDVEVIVVDRGSTDGSHALLRLYETELARWTCEPGCPMGSAVNLGLMLANGEYVSFLNADALLLPEALGAVTRELQQDASCGWLAGACQRLDGDDYRMGLIEPEQPENLAALLTRESGQLPPAGVFLKRQWIEQVGYLNPDLEHAHAYDLWCRLLVAGHAPRLIATPLAAQHEMTNQLSLLRVLNAGREMVQVADEFASQVPAGQRYHVWTSCDERRRIFALARAEAEGPDGPRYLWPHLLRHPWWLTDRAVRQVLRRTAA